MNVKTIIEYYKLTGLWIHENATFGIDRDLSILKTIINYKIERLKRTCDKQMEYLHKKYCP